MGRTRERQRYKLGGGAQARRIALQDLLGKLCEETDFDTEWLEPVTGFPEIPSDWMRIDQWAPRVLGCVGRAGADLDWRCQSAANEF